MRRGPRTHVHQVGSHPTGVVEVAAMENNKVLILRVHEGTVIRAVVPYHPDWKVPAEEIGGRILLGVGWDFRPKDLALKDPTALKRKEREVRALCLRIFGADEEDFASVDVRLTCPEVRLVNADWYYLGRRLAFVQEIQDGVRWTDGTRLLRGECTVDSRFDGEPGNRRRVTTLCIQGAVIEVEGVPKYLVDSAPPEVRARIEVASHA